MRLLDAATYLSMLPSTFKHCRVVCNTADKLKHLKISRLPAAAMTGLQTRCLAIRHSQMHSDTILAFVSTFLTAYLALFTSEHSWQIQKARELFETIKTFFLWMLTKAAYCDLSCAPRLFQQPSPKLPNRISRRCVNPTASHHSYMLMPWFEK